MREAPSIGIIGSLLERGAIVRAYDPMAMSNAESLIPDVLYCATPYDVAKRADALLIVTEWNEFKQLNFDKLKQLMRQPIILDGRNLYDPKLMGQRGFVYRGVGRGVPQAEVTSIAAQNGHTIVQNGHITSTLV
jgi:UDPglucose 6-dehydrogenase